MLQRTLLARAIFNYDIRVIDNINIHLATNLKDVPFLPLSCLSWFGKGFYLIVYGSGVAGSNPTWTTLLCFAVVNGCTFWARLPISSELLIL